MKSAIKLGAEWIDARSTIDAERVDRCSENATDRDDRTGKIDAERLEESSDIVAERDDGRGKFVTG